MRKAFVRLAALGAGIVLGAGALVAVSPAPVHEDSPGFDCRVHGNQVCGVEIAGTWYLVTFADGEPVSVAVRP